MNAFRDGIFVEEALAGHATWSRHVRAVTEDAWDHVCYEEEVPCP